MEASYSFTEEFRVTMLTPFVVNKYLNSMKEFVKTNSMKRVEILEDTFFHFLQPPIN